MCRQMILICVLAVPLIAGSSQAAKKPMISADPGGILRGGSAVSAIAARDSLLLIGPWGSGAPYNGQFETPDGAPAWNGWTSVDVTQATTSHWHVDTYNVVSGAYSAWCGEMAIPACNEFDPAGGYAGGYDELLSWVRQVPDNSLPATINISATANHDVEPGYDFVHLGYFKNDQEIAYLWTADGIGEQVSVNGNVTYLPGEYTGEYGDQVRITWHVTSDGGWDDGDCSYYGDGALQVDDITVTMLYDGAVVETFDDFENGTLGNWAPEFPAGVGNYAHLRGGLGDLDPCASNPSPQVCFIADETMLNERGLPLASCTDWCYDPGGYVVNYDGGLAGPDFHLNNVVWSPVINWPIPGYTGLDLDFDCYLHEELAMDSPGIFVLWDLRSIVDGKVVETAAKDRRFLYYGGPEYRRFDLWDLADFVEPGATGFQIGLEVFEAGYIYGWCGVNGTPAPYFDNVRLSAFALEGLSFWASEGMLAQDAFPADGQIHTGTDLGLNDVRFDMARDISADSDLRNDPGDSIVVVINANEIGATLVETDVDATVTAPRLHFVIDANEVFGADLRLPVGAFTCDSEGPTVLSGEITSIGEGRITGWVAGAPAERDGYVSVDSWMFDLPDADLLYPGDELHYYIEAWDEKDGQYRRATLPADITDWDNFQDPRYYRPEFTFRALPTLQDADGAHPGILLWNDTADEGGRYAWHFALLRNSYEPGLDYDVFYTNYPTAGIGNGLGGRATLAQIEGYDTILYTSGGMDGFTITPQDYTRDAGDDIGLLTAWLETGGKNLFATGDDLASDLWDNGEAEGQALLADWFGISVVEDDMRPMSGGALEYAVVPAAGSSLFPAPDSWVVSGGCPGLNRFDAVQATTGTTEALFVGNGNDLSAATRRIAANGSQVVSMPYDLSNIVDVRDPDDPGGLLPMPVRAEVLGSVLTSFGWPPGTNQWTGTEAPAAIFATSAHPNPFNPATRIDYQMPRDGHLRLRIYDVRGQLVRKLIDGNRASGRGHVMWDGRDDVGGSVATGVYFYEARTDGEVKVEKLLLLK